MWNHWAAGTDLENNVIALAQHRHVVDDRGRCVLGRRSGRQRACTKDRKANQRQWGAVHWSARLPHGPVHDLGPGFRILVFPPQPGDEIACLSVVGCLVLE